MSYIDNYLQPKETIVYQAKIHWFVFFPGIILLLIGVFLTFLGEDVAIFVGSCLIFYGVYELISAIIAYLCTDLIVTNKRTIVKTGLIRINVVELNHNKVESITFDQSLFGRIFDFGTVQILGTGGGKNSVYGIKNPLHFKKKTLEIIDSDIKSEN